MEGGGKQVCYNRRMYPPPHPREGGGVMPRPYKRPYPPPLSQKGPFHNLHKGPLQIHKKNLTNNFKKVIYSVQSLLFFHGYTAGFMKTGPSVYTLLINNIKQGEPFSGNTRYNNLEEYEPLD